MNELTKKMQAHFAIMCATEKLFRSSINGQKVWDLYLSGFSRQEDPVFRDPESSIHNCNLCNNFIRRYGNIVAINPNNGQILTLFDIELENDSEYKNTFSNLSQQLSNASISEVFVETFNELNSLPYESCNKTNTVFQLGIAKNIKRYTKEEAEKFGVVKPNETRTFHHFNLQLPTAFVDTSGKSSEALMAEYRDAKNVFQRAMETISLDTLYLVKDLINQRSLLDAESHLFKIESMINFAKDYQDIPAKLRDNWCWLTSYKLSIAKFRNELIGVLCSELSEGMELNKAVQNWNKRVDPINYMKAVAPITKRQIEEAKKFVQENDYEESFNRRFANIDDIKVSEILHSNIGDGKIKSVSIFDDIKPTHTRHKRAEFDGVEEVSIEKFMKDILPTCSSIEAFLQNNHENYMVSLTTANNPDSKPIFKWSNNYSWTFNGNIAGKSQIKEAVKSRGGNVDAVLRISLAFPDTTDDYDLHLDEPNGTHIYYGNVRELHPSTGMLDLDAQGVDGFQQPEKRVENITYRDKSKMRNGTYRVEVNNYSGRGLHAPFTLEVEIEGEITLLSFEGKRKENKITFVEIRYDGNEFTIVPSNYLKIIESKTISKEIYGLDTNQFHKVNLVCLSPNHWENNNVGNKHYFFMLDKCKSPISIRSFHNENLIPELAQHRKVLEVLGNTSMIEPTDKQLSGLGFNATVADELIVKLSGTHKRVVKIKF